MDSLVSRTPAVEPVAQVQFLIQSPTVIGIKTAEQLKYAMLSLPAWAWDKCKECDVYRWLHGEGGIGHEFR